MRTQTVPELQGAVVRAVQFWTWDASGWCTGQAIAELLSCSEPTVSRLLRGKTTLQVSQLESLAVRRLGACGPAELAALMLQLGPFAGDGKLTRCGTCRGYGCWLRGDVRTLCSSCGGSGVAP